MENQENTFRKRRFQEKKLLKKIGKYGKYAALTAIGTYTILSPKKAQASSPEDPGTGLRVNTRALEKIIDQQNEDIYEGIGDMYD